MKIWQWYLFLFTVKNYVRINEKSEENIFGGIFMDIDSKQVLNLKNSFWVDAEWNVCWGPTGPENSLEKIGLIPFFD